MAFSYYRTLTVTSNSALLPATQTNFPVLIYISHATLKTVANGGHINNSGNSASGPTVTMPYDLIFTSDAAGATKIPWEVESYDGTNGILWAWVKIASCALSTVFYCFYGDSSISTAQNTSSFTPANVWNSNFLAVWHLADGTTLKLSDSTSLAHTLTNTGTSVASTGKIDGSGTFNGSSQNLSYPANTADLQVQNITMECWFKTTAATGGLFLNQSQVGGNAGIGIGLVSNKISWAKMSDNTTAVTTASYNDGAWYHILCVYTSGSTFFTMYVNGVSVKTGNFASGTGISYGTTQPVYIARNFAGQFLACDVDEARIANVEFTANWITANYNTQSAPNTFCAIGAETALLAIAVFSANYRRRRT